MSRNRSRREQNPGQRVWTPEQIQAIIREGEYQTLVQVAEALGQDLQRRGLSTSQIRNVFGEVRRLQNRYDANRLHMLRPKLAYMAARAGRGGVELRDVLTSAIQEIFRGSPDEHTQRERFQRMVDFFEAILAYHKAYGGR